ncbi:MAG: VCBS repeat-containing protein [Myxococcota bacterium]
MNPIVKPHPVPLALALFGWTLVGCNDPQICVGDCEGESESEGASDGVSLEELRTCNVPTTADRSQCGDGVAQPGELCFHDPVIIALGADPHGTAVGDFDGDGTADVSWSTESGALHLRLGDAVDPLGADVEWPSPVDVGTALTSAGTGDLDGDGFVDVVTVSDSGQIDLMRGDGAGGFLEGDIVLVDPQLSWGPQLIDDDRDGDLDLSVIIAGARQNRITLLNDGSGTFTATARYDEPGAVYHPRTVAHVDDFVVGDHLHARENRIYLWRQLPDFAASMNMQMELPFLRTLDIEVVDFDDNGFTDLLLLAVDDEARVEIDGQPLAVYTSLRVFEGLDLGAIYGVGWGRETTLPLDCGGSDMAVADLDGDGAVDTVSSHHAVLDQSASLVVRLGGGAEPFESVVRVPAPAGIDTGGPVRIGDFDGDGLADVVTAHRNDDALVLYRGRR